MAAAGHRRRSASTLAAGAQPMRKFHFIVRDLEQFGNFSPKWTITGGRPPPRPPESFPGPGKYPTTVPSHRYLHTIAERREIDHSTETSNLPYLLQPEFPVIRSMTIGNRGQLQYSDSEKTPEPVFPPSDVGPRGKWRSPMIRISEKPAPNPGDRIPSPWRYDPIDPTQTSVPSVSLPRTKDRVLNDAPHDDVPGPGSYELVPKVHMYTKWAERLMQPSLRWHPPLDPNDRLWRVATEPVPPPQS
jgi:hypothetical protein